MRDEAFALQLLSMAERWAGACGATLRDRKDFTATVFSVTRRPEQRALLAAAVELYDLVGASVPGARVMRAMELDQAPSNLSVQLSDDPSRHLSVDSLERYIERTGDLVPIYFLVEKYIKPRDGRQEAALAQLPALAEQLQAMLKQAGMA